MTKEQERKKRYEDKNPERYKSRESRAMSAEQKIDAQTTAPLNPNSKAPARFCENPDCGNHLTGRQQKYCSARCNGRMTKRDGGPGRPLRTRERKEHRASVFGLPQRPHSDGYAEIRAAMIAKYPAYPQKLAIDTCEQASII